MISIVGKGVDFSSGYIHSTKISRMLINLPKHTLII